MKTFFQIDQQGSHNVSMFAHSDNVEVKGCKICECIATAVRAKESNSSFHRYHWSKVNEI